MADEAELKVGGFTFKGVYLAAALPLLGSLSGGIYYGYDVVNRFWEWKRLSMKFSKPPHVSELWNRPSVTTTYLD